MIQLYKQSPAQVVIIKNQTCKRLTLVLFDACDIDMTVRFIHHWSCSQNDNFHSKQKSKVTKPEKYTLDTLLTLAFQKPCYDKVLVLYVVETAGFEPASKSPDTNVSTCVVYR